MGNADHGTTYTMNLMETQIIAADPTLSTYLTSFHKPSTYPRSFRKVLNPQAYRRGHEGDDIAAAGAGQGRAVSALPARFRRFQARPRQPGLLMVS